MRIHVVTLFPEFFEGPLATGLAGKAIESGRVQISAWNPRDFTHDKHRTVDDAPYGGGGGMLMKPEPVVAAIDAARQAAGGGRVLLMTPQGTPLRQPALIRWAGEPELILVAGRYEGFDERIRRYVDEEVSLGDFVLTGGEYAALAIIDGVVRLLPGTLGNVGSAEADSFSAGLLEHPQYTRPLVFRDDRVPEVLVSGHHEKVAAWRRARSLERTRARRPDLLEEIGLDEAGREILQATPRPREWLRLAYGVARPDRMDEVLPLFARLRTAYDLPPIAIVASETLEWSGTSSRDFRAFASWEAVKADLGPAGRLLGATPPPPAEPVTGSRAVRDLAHAGEGVACLALGHGLVAENGEPIPALDGFLPSARQGGSDNDLPAPLAALVLIDRLLGEG